MLGQGVWERWGKDCKGLGRGDQGIKRGSLDQGRVGTNWSFSISVMFPGVRMWQAPSHASSRGHLFLTLTPPRCPPSTPPTSSHLLIPLLLAPQRWQPPNPQSLLCPPPPRSRPYSRSGFSSQVSCTNPCLPHCLLSPLLLIHKTPCSLRGTCFSFSCSSPHSTLVRNHHTCLEWKVLL